LEQITALLIPCLAKEISRCSIADSPANGHKAVGRRDIIGHRPKSRLPASIIALIICLLRIFFFAISTTSNLYEIRLNCLEIDESC